VTVCRFNPDLGFLALATFREKNEHDIAKAVSIPIWVFCPSRRLLLLG